MRISYNWLKQFIKIDWKSDETSCSFKVQGGIMIPLIQVGLEEPSKIFLKSGPRAPFNFDLTIFLIENHSQNI